MVNKFGKQEAEGKGFTPVIAEALERSLPVLVGMNGLNLPAFLAFADGLAEQLEPKTQTIADWCVE